MTSTEGSQIAGKVVAITGAGRGIGAATARLLAARGAGVVLGSRGEEELAATADAIAASGGDVAYQVTDITQPEQARALVDLATQTFGHLDVLASIAGVAINAPLQCPARLSMPPAKRLCARCARSCGPGARNGRGAAARQRAFAGALPRQRSR